MKKIKGNKEVFIILLVLTLGSFYWFQLRPTIIKKNCSMYTEITPADSGVTKEQAEINKKEYESCNTGGVISAKCWLLGKNSDERLPAPETRKIRVASKNEYDSCLRQSGL